MYYDTQNLIIFEQNAWPGNSADSCAETSREEILNPTDKDRLKNYMTPTGFVRHPNSLWREDDFSDDQLLPMIMANPDILPVAQQRLPYRAGNGLFHTPIVYAILWKHYLLANIALYAQYIFMTKIPYRWDDGKKAFERTDDMSCDWLNWFVTVVHLKRKGKLFFNLSKEDITLVRSKIESYYKPEPNNQQILNNYENGFNLFK